MTRTLGYGAALAAVLFVIMWLWINFMPIDAERWHIDPATARKPSSPNSFLYAPAAATAETPDIEATVLEGEPDEVLERFAAQALAAPRVRELTTGGTGYRTFVQRTPLMGFPDYISVSAVAVEGGSALIIFSRSQYGYGDWGVNRKRIEGWLSQL
ncbi:MAG: DUF1499 domain-containing protein [Pseudomonadota bacterium]